MQAAQQPPGAPPAGAPRAPRALSPRRLEELQLARDPFVGAISCCVWGLFMTKLYARQLAWRDNLQWMGLVVAGTPGAESGGAVPARLRPPALRARMCPQSPAPCPTP